MGNKAHGTADMLAATTILGTIGWFVVESGASASTLEQALPTCQTPSKRTLHSIHARADAIRIDATLPC